MKYNSDICSVEATVDELCANAFMSGDLGGARYDSEPKFNKKERLSLLQNEANGFYNTEIDLSHTVSLEGIFVTAEGTADGIIRQSDGSVEVDAVKCTTSYEFALPPSKYLLARLKCFAYFLCRRDGLDSIRGRISYLNVKTKKLKYFKYRLQTNELESFYLELLKKNTERIKNAVANENGRASAASAPFPYPELREGQELMIREGYSAIKRGKRIFIEAPTGTGKTVSSLYPAIRALGEGHIDKIFYLTAKASTRKEAFAAAGRLFEAGVKLRTIVLTAKEQICPCTALRLSAQGANVCDAMICPYAKGYYERSGKALDELLKSKNGYPRTLIAETAKKYEICPYELSLDLSELCHIIICDYNYAFDPIVYLKRYFDNREDRGEKYAFLIDEAHNLADRARDMYSAVVKRSELFTLSDIADGADAELKTAADGAIMAISRQRSLCLDGMSKDSQGNEQGFYLSREPLERLNKELSALKAKCDGWLRRSRSHPLWGELNKALSPIRKYLSVNEYFDKGFLCYVEVMGGDITVKTYCLDPSPTMNVLLGRAHSSLLFSATLTPPEYFCDVLGGGKNTQSISLPSPFDPENLCVTIHDGVSVRAEDRKKNYAKYANIIAATVSPKHGNYIAYFPSYECLEGVLEAFKKKYPKVEAIVQSKGMGSAEKESFLSAFKDDVGHLRIGFCVLGGAFSEGVDLPGSRLIGCIVFGVGIPSLSNERNIIMEYFDNTTGAGYDYAYTYHGMNRVLQAVGRVIRRDEDRGVAVLVDDRYAEPKYRAMFPKQWENIQYTANARSLAEIIRRFWKNGE